MDLKTLEKMTVVKLRDEAHKFDDIKDALGMSKEQLIDILCAKYNIDRSHHVKKGIGRRALKGKIKELRGNRQDVLASGDRTTIRRYRRRIKSLRRRLKKVIAHATRMEAKAAKAAKTAPEPSGGEEAPAQ